jgi:hypothetical protein
MIATSSTNTIAVVQPTMRRTRGQSESHLKIHASVRIEKHRHQRTGCHDEHQSSDRRQGRARMPQTIEHRGGPGLGGKTDGVLCRIHKWPPFHVVTVNIRI